MTTILIDTKPTTIPPVSLSIQVNATLNITADEARRRVNRQIISQLGTGLVAQAPELSICGEQIAWRVPIVLSLPGLGDLGEVGTVIVDAQTGDLALTIAAQARITNHARWLMPAPHYSQSKPGACLPACARMVLASFNDHRSESELSTLLEGYDFGTPAFHITNLAILGYYVEYRSYALDELAACLTQNLFPIVFVHAGFLPWADFNGFHALVLVEITEQAVSLLDPAAPGGPSRCPINAFLAAWEEFDRRAALVTR